MQGGLLASSIWGFFKSWHSDQKPESFFVLPDKRALDFCSVGCFHKQDRILHTSCLTSAVRHRRLAAYTFPHADSRLGASTNPSPRQSPTLSPCLPSLSHGVSREPPRPGHEGGAEGEEAAQGGGELHVEHHHPEGEASCTGSHSRHDIIHICFLLFLIRNALYCARRDPVIHLFVLVLNTVTQTQLPP